MQRLLKNLELSVSRWPESDYKRHLAVILDNNYRELARSGNQPGSRSSGSGHSDLSLHAEMAVLKRLGNLRLLRGATMVVVRFNAALDDLVLSKPCTECQVKLNKMCKKYGLKGGGSQLKRIQ